MLQRVRTHPARGSARVLLPWGDPIEVSVDEAVGAGISRSGVHELAVTEVMWRLLEPGDLAVDVGANAGYFALLMATRCAEVIAVEPNPELLPRLTRNLHGVPATVRVVDKALSDYEGWATLHQPDGYDANRGTATLESTGTTAGFRVETTTLDELLDHRAPGLLKLDVEGHEAAALSGARCTLQRRAVRDVIFEEHERLPTDVTGILSAAGYTIFALTHTLLGPRLAEPKGADFGWDAPTYLATADPGRAWRLASTRGWHALRPRGRRA